LKVDARPKTNLVQVLRGAGLDEAAINYLGFSKDKQAQQIFALYSRLNATERKAVNLDYLIMAAKADPAHIWGCINAELYREAELLVWINMPELVRNAIERALTPEGFQDAKLLFEMAGLLPVCGQPGPRGGASRAEQTSCRHTRVRHK
jgi:hypothetical protein